MSKPIIKVKGNIQNFNKVDKNIKPSQSNFLLTINTNQQFKKDYPHLKDDIKIFDNCINQILNNIVNFKKETLGMIN